ncbi:hypothetical protein C0J52_23803 [Blattella germanica]|nr:hypothetical protein C0J52_23803 [Blattella germanica]
MCFSLIQFSAVTSRGAVMATSYVLGEHAEKLVAAIAVKTLQSNHSSVIETGMKYVVSERDEKPSSGLTYQDFFYREVTKVHQLIQVLSRRAEDLVLSDRRPQEVANMIAESNIVILQNITLKYGARSTGDASLKNQLYDQLMHLVDIILDGRKCYLKSIRGTEKFDVLFQEYETERHNLIQPFLEDEEYERAAILAEKYCDFQTLVQICELTDNQERLDQYMDTFFEQSMISLAKLTLLASDEQVEKVDREVQLMDAELDLVLIRKSYPSLCLCLMGMILRDYEFSLQQNLLSCTFVMKIPQLQNMTSRKLLTCLLTLMMILRKVN